MSAVAGMVEGQSRSIAIEEHRERNTTDPPAASRNSPADPMLLAPEPDGPRRLAGLPLRPELILPRARRKERAHSATLAPPRNNRP